MTARSCDDWPRLMEIAHELQFKHYRASEVGIPTAALILLPEVALADVDVCCDIGHRVFNAEHTDKQVAAALEQSEWQELNQWTTRHSPPTTKS